MPQKQVKAEITMAEAHNIGVDDNGWILASKITDGNEQDPGQIPDLLNQFDGEIDTFVADGIYDQTNVYQGVQNHSKKVKIIIPPRKKAVVSGIPGESKTQRTKHIERIQDEGHFKWKRCRVSVIDNLTFLL